MRKQKNVEPLTTMELLCEAQQIHQSICELLELKTKQAQLAHDLCLQIMRQLGLRALGTEVKCRLLIEELQALRGKQPLYRDLSASEVQEFRNWARANYHAGDEIDTCWHPVVREECQRINEEAGGMTRLDDKKWCVVSGNPVDGIKIHGTFANHQDASDWAEREFDNTCDWWVTVIYEALV